MLVWVATLQERRTLVRGLGKRTLGLNSRSLQVLGQIHEPAGAPLGTSRGNPEEHPEEHPYEHPPGGVFVKIYIVFLTK